MNTIKLLSLLIILFLLAGSNMSIAAKDHSKEEVNSIISSVEKTLNKIKNSQAIEYASDEISKIESYIKSARKFLNDGEENQAYYEIKIGNAFFKLIDAKKELFNAQKEFEETNKKLNMEGKNNE